MSDNFKATLGADNTHNLTGQENAKSSSAKLSLCGNDQAIPSAATEKHGRAGGLYLIADNDAVTPAASPDKAYTTSATVDSPANNTSDTSNLGLTTDGSSDTTSKGQKTRVLRGGIEHREKKSTGDLYPGNAQQDNQEAPKPTVFYKMQAEKDDTAGREFDHRFMQMVLERLADKIDKLLDKNRYNDFSIPIPQGSEIYITCELDRKANVSNFKVEHSSNCELFDKLLKDSVNEVSGNKELYFPAGITDNTREEDCGFDLTSIEVTHDGLDTRARALIGGLSRQ